MDWHPLDAHPHPELQHALPRDLASVFPNISAILDKDMMMFTIYSLLGVQASPYHFVRYL
jgi:hypothetical protein